MHDTSASFVQKRMYLFNVLAVLFSPFTNGMKVGPFEKKPEKEIISSPSD